jgi:hypothetical protein
MNRIAWIVVVGLAVAAAGPTRAGGLLPPAPIPERVSLADAVIVGKVTGFGDKLVSAPRYPGGDTAQWQVALIRIDDAIVGGEGLKEIKVGFIPPANPDGLSDPTQRGFGQLTLDEEGVFFLVRRPDGPFYVAQDAYAFIEKLDHRFDKARDEVKRCARLLADPRSALKSKSAEDRFLTAALLVTRYRAPRLGAPVAGTEQVDAEESKLILQTLADADWSIRIASGVSAARMEPQRTFMTLDLQAADGWKQPEDYDEYPAAAKKWLKEHAATYRLRKYVYDDGKEKDEKRGP